MARIDELVKELCPDGVEYKALGEVGTLYGGLSGKTKADFKEGASASFVPYTNVFKNAAVDLSELTPVEVGPDEKQNAIRKGDVLLTTSSETPDECAMSSVVEHEPDNPVYLNSFCRGFRPKEGAGFETGFLKHLFRSHQMRRELSKTAAGVTRFNVSQKKLLNVAVPVPSHEVQQEIVRILDAFAELEANLQRELDARRKQFEYYRDELLSFDDETPLEPLGSLFDFKNGLNKGKDFFGHGFPIVNFTDVFNNFSLSAATLKGKVEVSDAELESYSARLGDVFFTRTSETREDVGKASVLLEDVPNCVFSGFVLRARPKTNRLLPRYCSYCFSDYQTRQAITMRASFTTRALTSGKALSKVLIRVPDCSKQEEIATTLDAMVALQDNLQRQIDLTHRQYEHYRDQLLDLPRKEA